MLAASKCKTAKAVGLAWRRASGLVGEYDKLILTCSLKLPDWTEIAPMSVTFKATIADDWVAVHQAVAASLAVQTLFTTYESPADKSKKLEANAKLMENVLAAGGCLLPANLGMAWAKELAPTVD